jgi:hypothetical protein
LRRRAGPIARANAVDVLRTESAALHPRALQAVGTTIECMAGGALDPDPTSWMRLAAAERTLCLIAHC